MKMKYSAGDKLFPMACGVALLTSLLGLSGCASADETTQQLGIQTEQNRSILAGEQQKTGELLSEHQALQGQLAQKKSRRDQLMNQPATPESQEELRQVNKDIAKLKQSINAFQN